MAEFDYTAVADPATYTDEEGLHALFAHMRKHDPVAWVEPEGFTPFWSITKHADIMEIERDKKLFINEPRTVLLNDEGTQFFIDTVGTHNPVRSLVQMDDPDHVKYRALAQAFFMPKSLRKFEAQVDEIAANFIKRLEGKTECDFVTDLAVWYPLHVVMMVLGVPEEDEARMLKLTQELFGAGDSDMQRDEDPEAIFATIADFHAYFTALSEDRRKNPQDDIATIIANAKIDGEPIPDFEALSYYIIVATAGHDTTSSSTAGGLLALLEHPEELAKLKANPELMPLAVNEMIRWVTRGVSTRHHGDNVFSHCFGCHQKLGSRPHDFTAWVKKELGETRYDVLVLRANKPLKRYKGETKEMQKHFKDELKRLRERRMSGEEGIIEFTEWD